MSFLTFVPDLWRIPFVVALGMFALWILMNLKTSRPDGTFVKVHPYRRMMWFIMPTRNESVVYYEMYAKADKLLEYIAEANKKFHCDVTHCVLGAVGTAFSVNPRMNRFVAGRRLYQRNETFATFSMKRQKLNRKAKISAVKMALPKDETFAQLCNRVNQKIGVERSDAKTYTDKELSLFLSIPRAILIRMVGVFRWLDHHNLLPGSFLVNDPMYTSIFMANLGSLNMGAGFHHLYEWGTCPLFLMVGKIEERPVVENGQVVVRKMIHLRYSYDERIDDGLTTRFGMEWAKRIIEDPHQFLGCLGADDKKDQGMHSIAVAYIENHPSEDLVA